MQRVSYEDSGIIADTRGQTTGTVTIQSANDSVCNVSIPDGTLSAFAGTFPTLFAKSFGTDAVIKGTHASSESVIAGYPTVCVVANDLGTACNFQLGRGTDGQMLIIIKPNATTSSSVGLIYNLVSPAGPLINGGTDNVTLLSGKAGVIVAVYRAAGSGVTEGWWAACGTA